MKKIHTMKDTIYAYLQRQVLEHPDALAITDGKQNITFAQLDQMIDAVASMFPPEPLSRVGIVMDHTPLMIAAIFAVLKSGGAYVPVEPSFPKKRIQFVMAECGVGFVITQRKYARLTAGFAQLMLAPHQKLPKPTEVRPDLSKPDGLAYVLYTSGSTGLPKGVMVTNANVCHYVRAFDKEFHPGPGDVMLQNSVCSFDIFVEEVFTTLLSGAALAIPSEAEKKDIRALMDFAERTGVTIVSGFPYLLLEMDKLPALPPSLRLLISGGDVLRKHYVEHLIDRYPIYNTYGPSETTVCASYFRCTPDNSLPDGTYPIGLPVDGTQIEIRDEQMRKVPDGTEGEICIFGEGVSNGYLGDRKEENKAFVLLPDGRRMYRSGDMGMRREDGEFLFFYRKDSQVMILGRRVEASEVENVLCNCPEVEAGVVVPNTDDAGLSHLTAYYVPRKSRFSLSALKRKMAQFLPSYMIPESFVRLAEIPLTPNGKPNIKVIRCL